MGSRTPGLVNKHQTIAAARPDSTFAESISSSIPPQLDDDMSDTVRIAPSQTTDTRQSLVETQKEMKESVN